MSWLRGLLGTGNGPQLSEGARKKSEPAQWRSVDDPGNPFGVELLDLTQLLRITAASESTEAAECSVSWRPGEHHRIQPLENVTFQPCELRYPAADELPDGIVYAPPSMDFKWVIAWVGGALRIARSWTGATCVVARGKLQGAELVLSEVAFGENSSFGMFSRDPVRDLDWLIRTHVFDQRIPMVVDEDGADLLEAVPISGFSPWGRALFCAARAFEPKPPSGFLCSAGDVVAASYKGDVQRVRSLLEAGHSATAPALDTYRPLQIAAQLGNRELVDLLIEHGASIEQPSLRGTSVLHAAIAGKGDIRFLEHLLERGASLGARDAKGFTPLLDAINHAPPATIRWLIEKCADLRERTDQGFAPVHIAAALGKLEALELLVEAGADPEAESPDGGAAAVAEKQGQAEVLAWLRKRV